MSNWSTQLVRPKASIFRSSENEILLEQHKFSPAEQIVVKRLFEVTALLCSECNLPAPEVGDIGAQSADDAGYRFGKKISVFSPQLTKKHRMMLSAAVKQLLEEISSPDLFIAPTTTNLKLEQTTSCAIATTGEELLQDLGNTSLPQGFSIIIDNEEAELPTKLRSPLPRENRPEPDLEIVGLIDGIRCSTNELFIIDDTQSAYTIHLRDNSYTKRLIADISSSRYAKITTAQQRIKNHPYYTLVDIEFDVPCDTELNL